MHRSTAFAIAGFLLLGATRVPGGLVGEGEISGQPLLSNPIVAPPPSTPGVDFVVIQTENADYLQTEFSGLPVGVGVVLDSISVTRQMPEIYEVGVSLQAHWHWAIAGRDSVFPAVRRVQFLDSLPLPHRFAPVGMIVRMVARVDTIRACSEGVCGGAAAPRVVRNYDQRQAGCAFVCAAEDSATVAQKIRDRFAASGIAIGLKPAEKVQRGAWKKTTGKESVASICEKLPGNLANWISQDLATFFVSGIAQIPGKPIGLAWSFEYPTGPAEYVYDRTSNPLLDVLEGKGPRLVGDTLVKYGRSLWLSGHSRRNCARVVDDSAVANDAWLVVPDTGSVDAVDAALSPGPCGDRKSAWRLSGDTVWLGKVRWPVLVRDLLGLASRGGGLTENDARSIPRLVGHRLDLPWSATVAIRDLAGKRLGESCSFEAGAHVLDLAKHRGAFLVEVRSRDGNFQRTIKGSSLER